MFVCVYVCLSVYPSIYLSVYLFIYLFVCLFIYYLNWKLMEYFISVINGSIYFLKCVSITKYAIDTFIKIL